MEFLDVHIIYVAFVYISYIIYVCVCIWLRIPGSKANLTNPADAKIKSGQVTLQLSPPSIHLRLAAQCPPYRLPPTRSWNAMGGSKGTGGSILVYNLWFIVDSELCQLSKRKSFSNEDGNPHQQHPNASSETETRYNMQPTICSIAASKLLLYSVQWCTVYTNRTNLFAIVSSSAFAGFLMSAKALLQGWFHCDTPGLDGVIVIFADSSVGHGLRESRKLKRSHNQNRKDSPDQGVTDLIVLCLKMLLCWSISNLNHQTEQIKLRSGQNLHFQFFFFILFTPLHTTLFTSPQMIQPSGHSRIAKLVFLAAFEWPNSTISPFFKGTGSAANLKTQDVNAKEKHILIIQLSKKSSDWYTYYIWLHAAACLVHLKWNIQNHPNVPCNPKICSHPRSSPTRNLGPWRSPRQVTFRPNS